MPILITSHTHHSGIADVILFGVCRYGPLSESLYTEGTGSNGKKAWGSAVMYLAKRKELEEKRYLNTESRIAQIDSYLNNSKYPSEVKRFFELVKSSNLKNYFPKI